MSSPNGRFGVFLSFAERLKLIRGATSQSEFAETLGIGLRTYSRYENEERMPDLNTILEIHKNFDVNLNWLITGIGNKNSLDPIFSPYFEILKNICPAEELEHIEESTINDMLEILNKKIADHLVKTLLKQVSEIPILEKFINMIIMNDVGATVRIWSIIEQADRDKSTASAKEKLIHSAQKGFVLIPHSKAERDFIRKFVETWPEEMCDYLLQNSQIFINVLKKISKQANSAITSNEKILKFIRRFNNAI